MTLISKQNKKKPKVTLIMKQRECILEKIVSQSSFFVVFYKKL